MIPTYCCYDGSVADSVNPFRPGIDTVGGAAFVDDQRYPPDPNTQLTAIAENQNEMLLVALSRVTPAAIMYITNPGLGSATITSLRSASSILSTSDIVVGAHSVGDVEITCPATKLIQPLACLAFTQVAGDYRASGRINATSDGVRVETRNSSGTPVDCDFVVIWL